MTSGWVLAGLSLSSALLACDEAASKQPPTAALERSQVVAAKPSPAGAEPASPTKPVLASSPPKKPRVICAGQMSAPGRAAPKKPLSQAVATGEPALPEKLALGGRYTWVNFWAAWCAPCKEEIPRLLRFEAELAKAPPGFALSFVSLDDDERQLRGFLANQSGSAGLRRSYWLREGREREEWLKAAGLEADPELPFHLLFDPKGKLRCVVSGAVEDADLVGIRALLTP